MSRETFVLCKNEPLAANTYRMELYGDTSAITAPGQFVDLALPGLFLRRPISVCDCIGEHLILIYKVVGTGTALMRDLPVGANLDVLTGLGNGFDLSLAGDAPLLVGGGVGVAPLCGLAKCLRDQGKQVRAILGFNTAGEIFGQKGLTALGCQVTVTTADGSYGVPGFVTAALPDERPSQVYACGPEPMLRALYKAADWPGQYSLEARMGCGFGACMGCTIETNRGNLRICKDGPVFPREVLPWQT